MTAKADAVVTLAVSLVLEEELPWLLVPGVPEGDGGGHDGVGHGGRHAARLQTDRGAHVVGHVRTLRLCPDASTYSRRSADHSQIGDATRLPAYRLPS